jgi:hypothetical protein
MEYSLDIAQFVIEHIISVLGGAGLLITALSAYLGKVWSNRALVREKNKLEASLLELKNRHALELKNIEQLLKLEILKRDQFHQISKQTFESVFEKKIEIYNALLNFKVEFYKFNNENHDFEEPTAEYHTLFKKCRKIIESNQLYISEDLSAAYNNWYTKALPYLKRANIDGFDAYENRDGDNEGNCVWVAQSPIFSEMNENTANEMNKILAQIERDISVFRTNIEAPMLALKT